MNVKHPVGIGACILGFAAFWLIGNVPGMMFGVCLLLFAAWMERR